MIPRYVDVNAVNRVFVDELWKIPSVFINERTEWVAEREAIMRCARGVAAIPTADVVKVVRCKDCVHHKNAPKTTDVWCERLDGLLPKDWFCADGERREDADN